MTELDCADHRLLRDLARSALDHHDAVLGRDHRDVDRAVAPLRVGRVDHELAVHLAHAHRAHRTVERNVRQCQRRACSVDADHVRIVFPVRGEDQDDDLGLIAEAFGEKRTHRAVDLAGGENLALARTAFALDESAGDAAACVGVLAIVDGEGEEVDAFFGIGRGNGGASTTDSPWVTSAAPDACLAIRPVSKLSRLPPASSTVTSCFIESSFLDRRLRHGSQTPHSAAPRQGGKPERKKPAGNPSRKSRVGRVVVGRTVGTGWGQDGGRAAQMQQSLSRRERTHQSEALLVRDPVQQSWPGWGAPRCRRIHLCPLPSPRIPSCYRFPSRLLEGQWNRCGYLRMPSLPMTSRYRSESLVLR